MLFLTAFAIVTHIRQSCTLCWENEGIAKEVLGGPLKVNRPLTLSICG